MNGLIGRKVGMTRVFDETGRQVAVTVIEAGPCAVVQRKTKARDGYDAVQLGFGEQKERRVSKPRMGRFRKSGVTPRRWLREFGLRDDETLKEGDDVTGSVFKDVTHVDVTGVTKGRGFQGVIKRWNMARGPISHGGHSKRRPGAIGQCSFPARVARGQRMPGHMGHVRVTVQNLRIVQVREEDNLLLVEGAVPGANGSVVLVRKALKKPGKTG